MRKKQQARKKRNSEFLPGPDIPGRTVFHCSALRLLMIDGQVAKFSRIEYPLVLMILKKTDGFVSHSQLIKSAYGTEADDDSIFRLRRRISNIRFKIWNLGIAIIAVNGCGYSYKTFTPRRAFDDQVPQKIYEE